MSTETKEQLSALMDGELERDRMRFLLKRLAGDSSLAPRWTRYHVARLSLRRQHFAPFAGGFADAVMARLELEPALAIPRKATGEVDVNATAQLLNDTVERWVREYPGQWLWYHDRWDIKFSEEYRNFVP